jgi:transcriptional antiterminator RfaH
MSLDVAEIPEWSELIDVPDVSGQNGDYWDGAIRTQSCGSLPAASSHRWYCASVGARREQIARDRLAHLGFGCFLPIVARRIRHARRTEVVERAMFPAYVFIRLDTAAPDWRRINQHGLNVRLHGATCERPTPLPIGLVEGWLALGWDKPIAQNIVPQLIAAGAKVRIIDGPFAGRDGVCLWSDATRVRVLMSLLGRQVEATVVRERVATGAAA